MAFNLEMNQKQELVMTPELQQAIEVLQYNSYELNQFIDEQMLENPVLEKEEATESEFDELIENIDWDAVGDDRYHNRYYEGGYSSDSEEYNYENYVSDELELIDYLKSQLIFSDIDGKLYDVAEYLIESIDKNGYIDYDETFVMRTFNVTADEIKTILDEIQEYEPIGVCARNIKECLLIQLRRNNIDQPLVKKIVENYLDEVSKNQLKKIAKALDVDIKKIQHASDFIKNLEPKPGRAFYTIRDVKFITPDVTVEKEKGEYKISINNYTAPRLYLSNFYKKIAKKADANAQEKEYINKKLKSAINLIKSIDQRKNTIYRVVEKIIEKQRDFFDKGKLYLKPLNMVEVSEALDIHESTVSRTVNGKYLQCNQGLFELKFFFQSGIKTSTGGVAAASIKMVIEDLIGNEDPTAPISDQFIADELEKNGISVSRRTIAKYRNALDIPSSRQRKRY